MITRGMLRGSVRTILLLLAGLALAVAGLLTNSAHAESGYDLWLRYRPLPAPRATELAEHVRYLVHGTPSPTLDKAVQELRAALPKMNGRMLEDRKQIDGSGALVIGTPESLPLIHSLDLPLNRLKEDGYLLRTVRIGGRSATVVAARSDIGVLYGTFALLRQIQTGGPLGDLDLASSPAVTLRLLNHWDNLDGSIERGYAGSSLWDWWTLPDWTPQRYSDYARANASIGINGTVLNNVNANAEILTPPYLDKVAALAGVFRPYGVRVFLSARFSAPVEIGGLDTADPLDPRVRAWWAGQVRQIYNRVPDFGGFLVKANSEGQPGPQDYGRSHADGANMLAAALKPHGGLVMWRAFVYANQTRDRVGQAFTEFKPLDGKFASNVLLQVKNGPLDFQPREPFHPLFGAMPHTPLMIEVQATKEYLGFATHLAYLGTLWSEVLQFDTHAGDRHRTVANIVSQPVAAGAPTGFAGVANIGDTPDWTGGVFNQVNWYALGRLAWDPSGDARRIAREWAAMTFTPDPAFVEPVVDQMLMPSREAVVDYTGPLGLTHQMMTGHHYGPGPWIGDPNKSIASSRYYSKAAEDGIGFDRTAAGTGTINQYAPGARAVFGDPHALDSRYLLWFHHVPWDFRLRNGETLWSELVQRYDRGVAQVARMRAVWNEMKANVDEERFRQAETFLAIQQREAQWWRDASLAFFLTQSKLPLPPGHTQPLHDVNWYQKRKIPHIPGSGH